MYFYYCFLMAVAPNELGFNAVQLRCRFDLKTLQRTLSEVSPNNYAIGKMRSTSSRYLLYNK